MGSFLAMPVIDNFDTLNSANWRISNAVANSDYRSTWNSNNVSVQSGKLKLALNNSPRHNLPYSGAQVVSALANYKYGRYSAWIKQPAGSGIGASLGLCSTSNARSGDRVAIDILGKTSNQVRCWIRQGTWLYSKIFTVPLNTAAAFHKYKIHWDQSGIIWSMNDQIIHTFANSMLPVGKKLPYDNCKIFLNSWAAPASAVSWAGDFAYSGQKVAEVDRFEFDSSAVAIAVAPVYLIVLSTPGIR
jgi:beta-glucanase (GH16 family)